MLQAPPAHKKTLEVFSLELPQAFPFERVELAQVFPGCRGKQAKNSPKGLKNQKGLVGAVVVLQGHVCAGHSGAATGSPTAGAPSQGG